MADQGTNDPKVRLLHPKQQRDRKRWRHALKSRRGVSEAPGCIF